MSEYNCNQDLVFSKTENQIGFSISSYSTNMGTYLSIFKPFFFSSRVTTTSYTIPKELDQMIYELQLQYQLQFFNLIFSTTCPVRTADRHYFFVTSCLCVIIFLMIYFFIFSIFFPYTIDCKFITTHYFERFESLLIQYEIQSRQAVFCSFS